MSNNVETDSWGTILVTGGGGFLGSHIVEAFAAMPKVHQVIMTGRNRKKSRKYIPKVKFELCDITDFDKTKEILARFQPKVIIHTISPGPFATKEIQLEVNYAATKHLLEAAKQDAGVQAFIYTSSIEACSSALGHISSPLREDEARVNNLKSKDYWYCRTKGAADTLVREANSPKPNGAKDWGDYLLTVCLRTPGLYGPRDSTIVPAMLAMVNTAGARMQYGPDTTVHEWLYIENAVLAHVLATRKLLGDPHGVCGEAFFITDGTPMKFHQFTRAIFKEAGDRNMNSQNPKFIVIPFWLLFPLLAVWEWVYRIATLCRKWPYVSRQNFLYIRKGIRISIEKSRERLGYEPKVTTEEGICRTVAWFKRNGAKKLN
ncbi:C-3 sterol dehydrogenase/C-4 decarboxylase-like protein [Lindgomyces ingoldianus]|uniref:C-3 sterol dehydrogenase/C-4 decarboxylase-like protein n=1 Tax=Lindgomyces ingoldianus TaxID=673940 RepID=A0ACB6RGK3_9PLEO|nr:C-3 sterol dehydrogenase/C-4 decarboxylase-like protein [Lindgomyces ingoldianus]KAF2478394.1 C-3 sterol dehydrogenase/C-4 decarboxylase-like protein [Lindgomyces ingoldianus]